MTRRSVSSSDSPGPRVPMPPPSRDRPFQMPRSRGSWYSSWASSTCTRPSFVRAWRAKMSRISAERSTTRRPVSSSSPRCCRGASSSSETTSSAPSRAHSATISAAFPFPTQVFGSGARRCCTARPATTPPAASTSEASSSSESSASKRARGWSSATRNARSGGSEVSFTLTVSQAVDPPRWGRSSASRRRGGTRSSAAASSGACRGPSMRWRPRA